MSDLNLRFLPWLRRGLARSITKSETGPSGSIEFSMTIGGRAIHQSLRMRGPGDVVGINAGQIIRVDPQPGTLDFEPNYFPYIEFISPDLPWMFTPDAPDADDHLLPWFTLITVREDQTTITAQANAPLPVMTVPLDELPPNLEEMWAWTHVQTTSIYDNKYLNSALNTDPESFISRTLSPRNLQANTAYIAALVPTFKAGVYAGLGLPIPENLGTSLAWSPDDSSTIEIPVYYSWSFQAGKTGDFETLVSRLEARELDETVGRRTLDVSNIGIPLPKETPDTTQFYGALVSPTAMVEENKSSARLATIDRPYSPIFQPPIFEFPDRQADPMREALYEFLTQDISEAGDKDYDYRTDDPVVTPAIYGREQLKGKPLPAPPGVNSFLGEEPIWYSILNTLPRTRGAAGLGVRIIRQNQETFMAHAWSEVNALRSINQTLQQATYASLIANRLQSRVTQLDAGEVLQITRSAHARILPTAGKTIWGQLREASVPNGTISLDFQRMLRTGGVVYHALRLSTNNAASHTEMRQLVVNNPARLAQLSEHSLPIGTQTSTDAVANEPNSGPATYTNPLSDAISHYSKQVDSLLANRLYARERPAVTDAVLAANQLATGHVAYIDSMTARKVEPTPVMHATRSTAARLQQLTDQYINGVAAGKTPARNKVVDINTQMRKLETELGQWTEVDFPPIEPGTTSDSLEPIATTLQASLKPDQTISAHLQSRISINGGSWGDRLIPTRFIAEPLFTDAVYRHICDLSAEYMLPGIGDIPQNTVGLVQVNGEFVEAVLIGANHEMSREMRWREYPAELSSTWFRRFWSSQQDDITNIGDSGWDDTNTLGENLSGLVGDDGLVLLIKGEVLRRYPNLAVYAVPATVVNELNNDGSIKRRLRVVEQPEVQQFPVFSGRLDRGIKFFGFENLTIESALGAATPDIDDRSTDGGYFFALQEQPTEPRFGLNEYEPGDNYSLNKLPDWSALSWGHFMIGDDPDTPAYLPVAGDFSGVEKPDSSDQNPSSSTWGTHSAEMARIVLQRPVRMLVHASAMLP